MNTFEPVPEPAPLPIPPPRPPAIGPGANPAAAATDTVGGGSAHAGALPVAVIQWRITDLQGRRRRASIGALSARTAARLIVTYSRPGDTVVSVGGDPALAGAAGAGGRRYHEAGSFEELRPPWTGGAALVVLPWPPPSAIAASHDLQALMHDCRRLLAPGGCTIAVLTPGSGAGAGSGDHSSVVTAAWQAGMLCSQHVVAVGSRRGGYPRSAPQDIGSPTPGPPVVYLELLVFTVAEDRHG